ncbi:MAG TPA: competence/damage-inducible protein A [Geobacteraceae bacterium]|nr:competence/damage-inducible protein A [Geobacteraceae bacterium]
MSEQVVVEIFVIGNEILAGDILDTNTNWLCKEIGNLGGYVARTATLRDDAGTIATEIRAALGRGTDVIFTSGGLGPTVDDLTLAGVAQGVGVKIQLHEQALKMIGERYDEMAAQGKIAHGGLNPSREKMAWLPEGAVPLSNPVGTACGVLLRAGKASIISLPGIPPELKGIFTSSLQPFLRGTFGAGLSAVQNIIARCNDETLMEPLLRRIIGNHPKVYIKSLVKTCGAPEIKFTLKAAGNDRSELDSLIDAASKELRDGLESVGVPYFDAQKQ